VRSIFNSLVATETLSVPAKIRPAPRAITGARSEFSASSFYDYGPLRTDVVALPEATR